MQRVSRLPDRGIVNFKYSFLRGLIVVKSLILLTEYRLLAEDWAKKDKRHPVVLPIVVRTRGVIPKQTLASVAKLKTWGINMQVSRLQKAAVKAVWKTLKSSGKRLVVCGCPPSSPTSLLGGALVYCPSDFKRQTSCSCLFHSHDYDRRARNPLLAARPGTGPR
jgi:hypothetical protein